MRAQQTAIKAQVARSLESGRPLKVIIGAGETLYDGWIATDIPALNILKQQHWALLFKTESIDRLLAEHVIEHLTPAQFGEFLRIARMFLAADGQIRFAVPDGHHPDGAYIERVRPGGTGEGADDHKVLYTCDLFGRSCAIIIMAFVCSSISMSKASFTASIGMPKTDLLAARPIMTRAMPMVN